MKRLEIFLKKNFYAATLPPTLPERQSNLTQTAGSTGQPPVLVICIPRPYACTLAST